MTSSEPGPLSEEAARLVGAAQDWLHRVVGDPATARIATGAPECCWCPLCQLIATLRGDRPELLERLTETQAALAATLRALAEAAGLGGPQRSNPTDQPATEQSTTEQSTTEQSTTEQPTNDQPATEQPTTKQPATAQPADRAGSKADGPKPPRTRKPRGSRVQPIPLDDEAG
ncbi:MAG TPA: hypothetical protein VH298_01935 [Jatrophihabitans sp.]|nr:hypothetical protein [Jatrophihabitans sp.]